jgi:Spy/CpxP family protein refolding chaperone
MQRSKQQALMFLLGAVLVGGVLGFSAERVMLHATSKDRSWAARTAMYDDLELTPAQRAAMDSVIDEKNRRVDSLLKPVKPQIDSVRANARTQFYRIFTAEQRAKFEARVREDSLRRDQAHRAHEREDSLRRSETQRTLEQTKK